VFFPGGGYIFNINNHHVPCSKIAGISNCIVIVPTLPLAPEYNQLQIINKAYMFICLIYNNSCKYDLNVKDFFCVSGHSSGGNIAALISIKARDEQSFFMPKITHQLLMSPRVDVSREVGGEYFKWCEYQDADIMLNSETQAYFATQYIPAGMDPKSKELSPYYADLRELPPTTIIFGEFDGLRGDAEIYCQKLSESGVPVEKFMCLGQVHNTMICRKVLFSGKDPAELAGELMDQQSKLTYHINCKL
jgi:acetyl esterase